MFIEFFSFTANKRGGSLVERGCQKRERERANANSTKGMVEVEWHKGPINRFRQLDHFK